jgi:rubrerythrin
VLGENTTQREGKEKLMSVWTCPTCNYEKDSRCKPKKCPDCDKAVEFTKKDETAAKPKKK